MFEVSSGDERGQIQVQKRGDAETALSTAEQAQREGRANVRIKTPDGSSLTIEEFRARKGEFASKR